jgi:hypothetical protein
MKVVHDRKYQNRSYACAACIAAIAAPLQVAMAEPDAAEPFEVYFTDRYSYDDNLFRVPDGLQLSDPGAPPVASLDDYINRASLGMRTRLDAARQVFALNLRFDDVRYANNDELNFRGGSGDLAWDWQLASNWSGRVNAKYDRTLASFSNYQFFARDVVDSSTYGGELRYAIGSRWAVLGAGSFTDSDHSAEIRKINKFKGETMRGGVEYRTPSGNTFALDYRDTTAKFPIADSLPGGLPFRYDEQQPGLTVAYAFTAITRIQARVARIERDYADPRLDDYSGATWNVLVHWAPRTKLYFDVKGWHELTAYTDAETDYFVSDGASITPTWELTSKVSLDAAFSYEKQDYVGTNVILVPLESGREDKVTSALFNIDYAPRDFLSFGLGYRWINRDSNRDLRGYDNSIISAQVKVTL